MSGALRVNDLVRYSRSACRQYGFASEVRHRLATVIEVADGYVTIRWSGGGGERNLPNWALEIVEAAS